ncbi:MAG: septum formation initiator family protein [Lachnospiraceae bacterium]|nr:septum formation initiator family protein [Lachnospiraceae bacterium]
MAKKKKRKNSKQFKRMFHKSLISRKTVMVYSFVAIILIVMAFGYYQMNQRTKRYQKNIEALNTEISELKETNKTLEKEKKNLNSDTFIERMARERLGMIRKDEVKLEDSEDKAETSTDSTDEDTTEDTTEKDSDSDQSQEKQNSNQSESDQ